MQIPRALSRSPEPSGSLMARLLALMSQPSPTGTFLPEVAHELLAAWYADGICIYLANNDDENLALEGVACAGAVDFVRRRIPIRAGDDVARCFRERRTIVHTDGSGVAFPLRLGDQAIGGIDVWLSPDRQNEMIELEALGRLIALGIQHLEDERRLEGARQRLESVRAVTANIMESMETVPSSYLLATIQRGFQFWPIGSGRAIPEFLIPTLQKIIDQTRVALNAEYSALGIGNSPIEPFNPFISSGFPDELVKRIGRNPRPVGVLGLVAKKGETLRIKDVRQHPAFHGFPAGHLEIRSMLGVPVRYGTVSLGNLYFGKKFGHAEFSVEDQKIAEQVADFVASALQQAFLHGAIDVQHAQIQAILDSAPTGILFVEKDTDRIVANPRAMEIIGHPVSSEKGRRQYIEQVYDNEGRKVRVEDIPSSRALRGEVVHAQELKVRRPDGTWVPVVVSAAPVVNMQKRVIGAVGISEDITERRELDRMRQEFSAMVVHDLRTPLQAIQSQIELLLAQGLEEKVLAPRRSLEIIEKSTQRLSRLVGDLLDFARIEIRNLPLNLELLDPGQEIERIIERILVAFPGREVDLSMETKIPKLRLDRARFEQVMVNLLENGLKYSDAPASVSISLQATSDRVTILVEDRGMGIPEVDLPFVFERFYRVGRTGRGGLGLGLYITKQLVDAHQGDVKVESQLGKGSIFRVSFPIPR